MILRMLSITLAVWILGSVLPVGAQGTRAEPKIALLIGNNPMSPAKGTATLTDAQAADLMAGNWYVNVHTAEHRGGEIRGQVTK